MSSLEPTQAEQSVFAETRKAWVSALMSGLASAVAVSSQMDFAVITGNQIRDLVVAFVLSALASGGVTYAAPNKPSVK